MTRFVPELATATHTPFPYATEFQSLASAAGPAENVSASFVLLNTRFAPVRETIIHTPLPYATNVKKLNAGDTTLDHDLPNVNGKMSTIKSAKSLSFVRFAITLFAF